MIEVKQTILHDPANGLHGNCLSAVLASLLRLPIEEVPIFSDERTWIKDLNAWLKPKGLAYLSFPGSDFPEMFAEFGITGVYHELGGTTSRFTYFGHACVGYNGSLVFDPHPSNNGLDIVDSCGVFIALQPWKVRT